MLQWMVAQVKIKSYLTWCISRFTEQIKGLHIQASPFLHHTQEQMAQVTTYAASGADSTAWLLHRHELTRRLAVLGGRMVTQPERCSLISWAQVGKQRLTVPHPLPLNSYLCRSVLVTSCSVNIFNYMFVFNYHSKESQGRKLRCQYHYLHHHCEYSY